MPELNLCAIWTRILARRGGGGGRIKLRTFVCSAYRSLGHWLSGGLRSSSVLTFPGAEFCLF